MSASVPNGTQFAIAWTYGAAVPMTTVSNAAPPVVGSVGHGLNNGDIGVLASGWNYLNDRAARVAGRATDTFNLEGYDATDVTKNAPGAGGGNTASFKKVATWMPLSQTTKVGSSGGDQNYVKWKYLEDGVERQKPTYKNAKLLQCEFADDPTLPFYPVLVAADAAGTGRILRAIPPSGGALYYNVFVSFDAEPSFDIDQIQIVKATFSQVGPLIRYLT